MISGGTKRDRDKWHELMNPKNKHALFVNNLLVNFLHYNIMDVKCTRKQPYSNSSQTQSRIRVLYRLTLREPKKCSHLNLETNLLAFKKDVFWNFSSFQYL